MKRFNFSILCAGNIARKMAETVSQMEEVTAYAVAAREISRAQALAEEFGFSRAYGSYEELVCDEAVDLVYIASPHPFHYEHVKLCLEHGKHVLCEKPFTVNAGQAEELFALARQKNRFLGEAVWTRFLPFAAKVRELLESGAIGEPCTLTATFGEDLSHVERLVSPQLAGGALLDLGVYPLHFASMFFGTEVEKIESSAVKSDRGVDAQNSVILTFKNGRMAVLNSSFLCGMKNSGVIYGTLGRIEAEPCFCPQSVRVIRSGEKEPRIIDVPFDHTGYEYEVRAAVRAISEGKLFFDEMPPQETMRILGITDQLRAEWGIHYSFE